MTVFHELFLASTGPGIQIFKKFKSEWLKLKTDKYTNGLQNFKDYLKENDFRFIKDFCTNKLNEKWPRDNFCEF